MILKLHSFIFLAYIICSKGYFTKRFIPLQKLSTKSYCTIKIGEGVESDKRIIPFNAVNTIDKTKINALIGYKFSRPHTIKGTLLASFMGVARAMKESPRPITNTLGLRFILGVVALLCGNLYIVGLNQIYDIEIDKINKPYLPIASKLMSAETAWVVCLTSILVGISIVRYVFSPLLANLYLVGVLLGTMYSIPPIQLKRFPVLAGGTIALVRGFLLNFGVYYAVREAFSIPFTWNPVVIFISTFMTVFAGIIAITKDLPDIEGDAKNHISTFATRYGIMNVAIMATGILSIAYTTTMLLPYTFPHSFHPFTLLAGHSVALVYLLYQFVRLYQHQTTVKQFYKAIWNLFYLEYLLYPFV